MKLARTAVNLFEGTHDLRGRESSRTYSLKRHGRAGCGFADLPLWASFPSSNSVPKHMKARILVLTLR